MEIEGAPPWSSSCFTGLKVIVTSVSEKRAPALVNPPSKENVPDVRATRPSPSIGRPSSNVSAFPHVPRITCDGTPSHVSSSIVPRSVSARP